MNSALLLVVFAYTIWLGLYLLGRDLRSLRLRLTSFGLLSYALAVACELVASVAGSALSGPLEILSAALLFLPALCWIGALVQLLPEEIALHPLLRWMARCQPVVIAVFVVASIATDLAIPDQLAVPRAGARVILDLFVLGPLLTIVVRIARLGRSKTANKPTGTFIVALLFFSLSTGLVIFPFALIPRFWALLLLGFDLGWLGAAIARYDAFDLGEWLAPDMTRSLVGAAVATLVFGGQMALGLLLTSPPALVGLFLLLTTIVSAIAATTLGDRIGGALDRLVLARQPAVSAAREELRSAAANLPRHDPTLDPRSLSADDFSRHTRRALSDYGDLSRLGSNPLINLTLIDRRLAGRPASASPLERAVELKAVLAESVGRLKPRTGEDFGTSEEWRYYNVLYFPYILGLKPNRRRGDKPLADPAARAASTWLRDVVPERTLHNWQAAAARLVARDLQSIL